MGLSVTKSNQSAVSPCGKRPVIGTPTALGQTSMEQSALTEFSTTAKCPTCEKTFDTEHGVAAHHWQAHDEKLRIEVQCDSCGASLSRNRGNLYDRNYCDSDCMYSHQRGENHHNYNSVALTCSYCESDFTRQSAKVGNSEHPMCSRECYGKWLAENIVGENHHQWTRKESECAQCGASIWRKEHEFDGREHFCDTKCLSEWRSSRYHGTNHPNWRGGYKIADALRRILGPRSWQTSRDSARQKGDGTCDMCGVEPPSHRALDVHHIVPLLYGGTNGDYNLTVLCQSCHGRAEWVMRDLLDPILVE